MLTVSRAQVDRPIEGKLRALWHEHAMRAALPDEIASPLGEETVGWVMAHAIKTPENVDFVMSANAQSQGAFLRAPEIHEAMRLTAPQYDMAVTVLRRQTRALVEEARV